MKTEMKFYYQYQADEILSARIKSAQAPLGVDQIVLGIPLMPGIKRFNSVTKEVIFFKHIRETSEIDGEIISTITDTVEDKDISHKIIQDQNIISK